MPCCALTPRDVGDELIATGRHWATSEQIATLTGLERSHVYPGIQRLVRDNKLFSPARGLYVAIPPEYRKGGSLCRADLDSAA